MLRRLIPGLAVLALIAGGAQAQPGNCAPREVVVDRLATAYGETRQSMGLGAQGAVMEVFASQTSGSWTITVTLPDGLTCLIASGRVFEAMAAPLPKPGSDA
ncbi:hypothetical protein SAMN04488077_10517 [Roseovarius tolerans]|uniref:Uncharacterized protein n=1 Tax=Roseovarius tolerans TaxID=74031 RepID=A0A1H7YKT1_9RHOB|nr:hypothetical protein [Roseovarius tolerans]SEM46444.1 hypothetical protein SAMN04488077_10517 [Roseovarius tolerans]